MLPVTLARVPHHTSGSINERLRMESESRVAECVAKGPEAISCRLAELREEWDIDRACELHGGVAALGGVALAGLVDKRFLAIPALIGASLALGALFGWSPQYVILRRLGFRTLGEIERERRQLLVADVAMGGGAKAKHNGERMITRDELELDDVDVTISDDLLMP